MNPSTIQHLLTLCMMRRAEILLSLRLAKMAGRVQTREYANLESERQTNDAAIAELEGELVAA